MHVTLCWISSLLVDLFRPRAALLIENAALRQQLAIVAFRKSPLRTKPSELLLWIVLVRCFPRWRELLMIIRPETLIRRHRQGFKAYWRWRSRRQPARPTISNEIQGLIRRMARENPTWGAPRIHGELTKLGIEVSERTVARFMPRRPSDTGQRLRWKQFLATHRHAIVAADFLTVPTITFRVIYVFFVIGHGHRRPPTMRQAALPLRVAQLRLSSVALFNLDQ